MHASDVMSRKLATAGAAASVVEIAGIMMDRRISAVPIVDDGGALVGIVSEGDLIRRQEIGTEKHPSWWLQIVSSPEELAIDYVKSHATRAADIMTRELVTVGPDADLSEIARLLERHCIKRVPVVENGKLVGIVSRADLIRSLAAHPAALPAPAPDDEALRERVAAAIREALSGRTEFVNVIVTHGVVHLWGGTDSEQQKTAIRVAAESASGGAKVEDHLGIFSSAVRAAMGGE